MDVNARLHGILQALGFEAFRGKQEQAITAALEGRDCLVLMPTGGGKSLCYAMPAVVTGKMSIVVSPLIALMQDQVSNFNKKGISSDYFCSTRTAKERDSLVRRLQSHSTDLRLLFVTPESFGSDQFLSHLQSVYARGNIALVAIDEAHCISSWGHDFRPAYRRLSAIRRELPRLPIMALTATATKQVQDDIIKSVLRDPMRLVSSFNRANISYHVRYQLQGSPSAVSQIADIIQEMSAESGPNPCCIVYTLKRETADEVAWRLNARGVKAVAYHAGLKDAQRSQVLQQWSCGQIPVVAATIAFGMGIDRACVRLVAHLNLPKTLEGFYQESGRAGRDGLPSRSVLFYDEADRERMDWILSKEEGRKRKKAGGSSARDGESQAGVDRAQQAFSKVVDYCVAERCRRALLLEHFGERLSQPCSACDWCLDRVAVSQQLSLLAMEGPKRRREMDRRLGARGYADSSYAPGVHNGDDEDEIESSSGDSGGQEAVQAAADAASKALKQARRGGSQKALFQELERAERRFEMSKQERMPEGRGDLLLRKLEKGQSGPVQKPQPGSASVSEATREAGVQKLLEALRSCPAAAPQHVDIATLQSAAQAMEQECFASSASKTVYLGKLAHHRREAQHYAEASDMLQWLARNPSSHSTLAQQETPELETRQPHHASSSAASTGRDDRDCAEDLLSKCAHIESVLQQAAMTEENGKSVLADLHRMQHASVSAAMLKETGLGHRLRSFSKHRNPQVAAAAKAVIEAWKARICK